MTKSTGEEHRVIRSARVLDSARSVTLRLLGEQVSWLRSSEKMLFDEMADPRMMRHAHSNDVARHAIAIGVYLEQLKERNAAMEGLQLLAEELGIWNQWPSEIKIVVVFTESAKKKEREQRKKLREVAP